MKISKEVQADARRLMKLSLKEDGSMDETIMRHIISTVCERQPRNYAALLVALRDLVRLFNQSKQAKICSAVPLSPAQQNAIMTKLNAQYSGLQYTWLVQPELIGGMTVQVGDNLIDASLQSRIQRLSQI